jgi:hypothetical protein
VTAALTRQETFDKAAAGLLAQGIKSTDGHGCAYRGVQGRKCGIGFLIDDEHYREELEGNGIGASIVGCALAASGVTDTGLAYHIQRVHDDYSPESWLVELDRLARVEGLLPYPRKPS